MAKIVVGISGGVDSSVAAYLLKKQGHDVIGLFMINWHDTAGILEGDCPWHDDLIFAELVTKKLDIPLHTVDFSDQYRKRVVDYMFDEYQKGRTPNPDVLCNREVKFDLFLEKTKELKADYIATGHYCRKDTIQKNGKAIHRLLAGSDPEKDQSYFLCQLNQRQLAPVIFPIGQMLKSEIRKIAAEQGLATAKRKDSQGICFVGKVDLPKFLQQKLHPKEGVIIEIPKDIPIDKKKPVAGKDYPLSELIEFCNADYFNSNDGSIIGKHNGAHYFTVGQRKGLNVGGKKEPLFVLSADTDRNVLYVGQSHNHPCLNRYALFIAKSDIHWIREDLLMNSGEKRDYMVRIRYRQPLQKATLYMQDNGIYILFARAQRGITSGQFAAWYDDDELLGSGVIE
ncbi:tRNA-specific 2-thiouridylase MnmA [subsurface metagenome]